MLRACRYLITKLHYLNLFSNPNKIVEGEDDTHLQRLSTRIYIILFFVALTTMSFYSSFALTTNIITKSIDRLDDYLELANKYNARSSTSRFECLCQTLSIARSSYILQLEPSFHDICSSTSLDDKWLAMLYVSYRGLLHTYADMYSFRGTAFSRYQALKIICGLVKEEVMAARTLFLNSTLITLQMIDQRQFEMDTIAAIEEFKNNLPRSFLHVLQLVQGLNQANGLISTYSTNWRVLPIIANGSAESAMLFMLSFEPQYYGDCNCATAATCKQYIDPLVPGYAVGCLPLESLLQSSLECHYNKSCIQYLYPYITRKCH